MTDEPQKKTPPGWFPDPNMTDTRRYWNGEEWTDDVAPAESASPQQVSQLVVVAIIAASVIGLIMAMQSASLLTGTGTQWTGFAIACAGAIATWILRSSVPRWLRILAVAAALLALVNVISLESALDERRQEIGEIFGS